MDRVKGKRKRVKGERRGSERLKFKEGREREGSQEISNITVVSSSSDGQCE